MVELLRVLVERTERLTQVQQLGGVLWDKRDVSAYLKRSVSSVAQLADEGIIPSFKVGGHRRFDPDAVREWVRQKADVDLALAERVGRKRGR